MNGIEKAARALCERHIRRVRRHDTEPDDLEAMLPQSIDYAWPDFADDAQAAIAALRESEPVAYMVISPNYPDGPRELNWKGGTVNGDESAQGWREVPLYALPTPPETDHEA